MSVSKVTWRAELREGVADAYVGLDVAARQLRAHSYVVNAVYDYDPETRTVIFALTVQDTVTRSAAIHRASKALRESLRRAEVGIPHLRPYGPEPRLRLILEPWPAEVRQVADGVPAARHR